MVEIFQPGAGGVTTINGLDGDVTLAAGTNITLGTVGNTITINSTGGGTWGSITGTLSSQTDLQNALNAKQATLVSATNIKTINGTTLLGSGDLTVTASAAGSTTEIQYRNAGALAGSSTFTHLSNNDIMLQGMTLGLGLNSSTTNQVYGYNALSSNTNADGRMLAIGYGALQHFNSATDGYNVALGMYSLYTATSGSNNMAIGYGSMYANIDGHDNVGIGYGTLIGLTHGTSNVALGTNALRALTTGVSNIAVGFNALYNSTADNQNVAFGDYTLFYNNGGAYNVGIGTNSLTYNTTGNSNLALGAVSLYKNTTGYYNMGIGQGAYGNNTTANFNMGIGVNSGYSNTTGTQNIAIGFNALYHSVTGDYNTAIGISALQTADGASFNFAIGQEAGFNITSGGSNTLLGFHAGHAITTGTNNVGFGIYSLNATTTTSSSLALGTYAGAYETGAYKLFIDNLDRGTEAAGRTNSMFYGVFNATVANQTLTLNAGTITANGNLVVVGEIQGDRESFIWGTGAQQLASVYMAQNSNGTVGSATRGQVMQRAGSIIGYGVSGNCAVAQAGATSTFSIQVNGSNTLIGNAISLASTGDLKDYKTVARGTYTFVAGDVVAVYETINNGGGVPTFGSVIGNFTVVYNN